MKVLTTAFVSLCFGASSLFGAAYDVDGAHTNVAFKVKHLMISTVNGEFKKFDGKFEIDDTTKKLKSMTGEIDVASINTNIDKRDEHLRSADIFDAKKFPKITFVLDKIEGDKAYGKLTMKGITKEVVFNYEFGGTIEAPSGLIHAGFVLSGEINRIDYDI